MDQLAHLRDQRLLVFGAGGFIGTHLMALLDGLPVSLPQADFDIRDAVAVEELVRSVRPTLVINLAGMLRGEEPDMAAVHVAPAIQLARLASELRFRLLSAGSAAEYGSIGAEPVAESHVCHPESAYGRTKEAATRAMLLSEAHVVVFRPSNVIGPGMADFLLLGNLIAQLKKGATTLSLANLHAVRDYIDVRDLARGIVALSGGEVRRGIYNLSSGIGTTTDALVQTLRNVTRKPVELDIVAPPAGSSGLDYFVADPSKARAETGFSVTISLEDSVRDTWGAN